ncbi:MAG TPA: hypothetical protein VK772_05215 [Puia sp.]|nr:hypothetical protein [Puia sp.]
MNKVFLFLSFIVSTTCRAQGPIQPAQYKKYNPSYHFYTSGKGFRLSLLTERSHPKPTLLI